MKVLRNNQWALLCKKSHIPEARRAHTHHHQLLPGSRLWSVSSPLPPPKVHEWESGLTWHLLKNMPRSQSWTKKSPLATCAGTHLPLPEDKGQGQWRGPSLCPSLPSPSSDIRSLNCSPKTSSVFGFPGARLQGGIPRHESEYKSASRIFPGFQQMPHHPECRCSQRATPQTGGVRGGPDPGSCLEEALMEMIIQAKSTIKVPSDFYLQSLDDPSKGCPHCQSLLTALVQLKIAKAVVVPFP